MRIDLPIKLHNKFEIEVKDIRTGEIVQRGNAENIVLDHLFTTNAISGGIYFGHHSVDAGDIISFGSGGGLLSADRTTLFNKIGHKTSSVVEEIRNTVPLASLVTKKVILAPEEYVGSTITEVGIGPSGNTNIVFTHALIKDSEGNNLSLGPKTDMQEITIYETNYFVPAFEGGITLPYLAHNSIISAGLLYRSALRAGINNSTSYHLRYYINNRTAFFETNSVNHFTNINNVFTLLRRIPTTALNTKIKSIQFSSSLPTVSTPLWSINGLEINLETLAQNESVMWSGYEFDKTPIGVGNGEQTVFNLTWDEAWLEKTKTVYVDGVVNNNVTWVSGGITFNTAPANGAVITADYWVKYAPKDIDHVLDFEINLPFGEGSA